MTDNKDNQGEMLHCSFCGKSQEEVKKLIAGRGVYICDECIEVCINIVADEMAEINKAEAGISYDGNLPTPPKSKSFWTSMSSGRSTPKRFCQWPFTTITNALTARKTAKMWRLPNPTLF